MNGDAIPEAVSTDEGSDRITIELCRDEYGDHHCVLVKGHTGVHEAVGDQGPTWWYEALPDRPGPATSPAGISSAPHDEADPDLL